MIVRHKLIKPMLPMAIVPLGPYLNKSLTECRVGQKVQMIDGEYAQIIDTSILYVASKLTNVISISLYGKTIDYIFSEFMKDWEFEMYQDRVLLLVLKAWEER